MHGHADHFLSRLDRVSLPHVELALSLYRDPDRVRYVLERIRLPGDAGRVALSLEDPERGPFLVVTRDGHFVTCLGEGMSPGQLPVVARGQLDALARRLDEQRARDRIRQELVDEGRSNVNLLRQVYLASDALTREEMAAILSLAPLLRGKALELQIEALRTLVETRESVVRVLRRTSNPRGVARSKMEAFWRLAWALAHHTMITAETGRDLIEKLPASTLPRIVSLESFSLGTMALATRGLWAAAKIGKALVGPYKRVLDEAEGTLDHIGAAYALLAIGVRHQKHRAEIAKALTAAGSDDSRALAGVFGQAVELAFEHPEEMLEVHLQFGRGVCHSLGSKLPAGHPYQFARPEDVPEALAMSVAVNHQADYVREQPGLGYLACFIPWLARANAEDLYLPRDYARLFFSRSWTPEHTARLLAGDVEHAEREARETPRPEGPARKGPCPCGSGKKYKRCCEGREVAG